MGDRPKKYKLEPEPGGEFPAIGDLLTETMEEFQDNMAKYVLAGVGQFLVIMPVVFVGIFVLYFGIAIGMGVVMVCGAIIGGLLAEYVNEGLGFLVLMLTQLGSILVPILFLVAFIGGLAALLAPFNASLVRAVAGHQRGELELDFPAVFATVGKDLPKVIGAGILLGMMSTVGLMMCYFPALAVPIVFGFVAPLVALHRLGAIDGVKTALAHFMAHSSWVGTLGVVYLGLSMVAAYVPILGPAFILAFHVRAYRKVFGDGETAVLS